MAKEMNILLPTTKIQEAVKCKNTKQAYKIFRDLLDYEEYELKSQEHFWIMGIDSFGTSVYRRYMLCVYTSQLLVLRTGLSLTPWIFSV